MPAPTPVPPQRVGETLSAAARASVDDVAALGSRGVDAALLPELPSPAIWVLVALARHEQRQRWVAEVIRTHLKWDPARVGAAGWIGGHPEGPNPAPVPGLGEWEYYFHGKGCRLTHRIDGTDIDVDFEADGSADTIALYFYGCYLESLRTPELPERVLRQPELSEWWHVDLETLEAAECIGRSRGVRLTELGRDVAASIEPIVARLNALAAVPPSKPSNEGAYLALALGDAQMAAVLCPHAVVAGHADRARLDRAAWLGRRWDAADDSYERARLLQSLAAIGRDVAEPRVLRALGGMDGGTSTALKIIERWDDPRLDGAVEAALARAAGVSDIPGPYIRFCAGRILVRHCLRAGDAARRRQLAQALTAGSVRGCAGDRGLLLHALDPAAALTYFAQVLDSTIPDDLEGVAAALALIGSAGAKQVLLDRLRYPDHARTREARAALLEMRDPRMWQAVRDWEARHGVDPPPRPTRQVVDGRDMEFLTMSEVAIAETPAWIRYRIERWRTEYAWLLET